MATKVEALPKAFIWRRLHSLTGLWFVLFLIEHLITNSQAALLLGESGQGFVRAVNFIHNIPYLTVIEVGLLGVPILIHVIWGVRYSLTARPNSMANDGSRPHLKYGRNHAYTWQRITSWLLIPLLLMHIVKFRFLDYPESVNVGSVPVYLTKVSADSGLYTVAGRLNVKLFDAQAIDQMVRFNPPDQALNMAAEEALRQSGDGFDVHEESLLQSAQENRERVSYVSALSKISLKPGEVVAASPTFGTASLLGVRDTFKSPFWVAIYTLFVLCASFHAFNGLWTSMLTWGWVIRATAQTGARKITIGLMVIIAALGLIAVWGTYFLNLKH